MTHVDAGPALATEPTSSEAMDWVRANWVKLAAIGLIAASLWIKGAVLAHSYFRQDDFAFFDRALGSSLSQHFLMRVYNGHLMPGSMAYVWVLARLSLYDWSLTSTVTVVVLAISALALFRLLRTLFGDRPAVLIPLTVYLFTPILLPGLGFWSTTFQWLPTQLVIAMATNAHLSYVRSGRFRHAAGAAAWMVAGLLFDDVAVLLPLLFLALTSGFLLQGRWSRSVIEAVRKYWRAWVLYGVLLAGYALVFVRQLPTSGMEFVNPGPFTNVLTYVSTLIRVSLIPSALGGPWHWLPLGDLAFALEFPILTYLAWLVAAGVVTASLWYRRRAYRAWVILATWVFFSAVVPIIAGRVGFGYDIGTDLHYLADSAMVLALCVGLAFWPVVGEESAYRGRPHPRFRLAGTIAVMTAFLAGSLWSARTFVADTSSAPARSYLATGKAAIAGAPDGAVIMDALLPENIENGYYFGRYGYTEKLFGPLVKPLTTSHLSWTRAPSGVIANLLMVDASGRLAFADVLGRTASPPRAARGCWKAGTLPSKIHIPGTAMYRWPWTIELAYRGRATNLEVTFDGHSHAFNVPAGQHDVYIPALGSGSNVGVQVISGGPTLCITQLNIGVVTPAYHVFPIPVEPLPG